MRYADEFSDFSRFEEPIQTLLKGVVFNSQRWEDDQDDAPLVADAIKYHSRPVERPDREPYPQPGEPGYDEYVGTILRDVLGFDAVTRFQETCWSELNDLRQQRANKNQTQGAVLSAPTGFGKTEGFAGPILHDLAANDGNGFGKTVIVYPRNALLEDQLERFLLHINRLNQSPDFESDISIGIYNGEVPRNSKDIQRRLTNANNEFSLAQWTGGDEPQPLQFSYTSHPDQYELQAADGTTFDESVVKLSRDACGVDASSEVPDILLTTINSLENFGLKPNYNIIDDFRTFIFDEIHLYTETYGSHASNIINNAKRSIRERGAADDGMVFIGSSATVDRPKSLGSELFGIDSGDVRVIETGPEDKLETDDTEHFHFVASDQDLGTSSTFIQQILLFAHALLDERGSEERKKALAFIDSISQVNQRYVQIQDFEEEERWSYHDQEADDWDSVATETPYRTALPEETAAGHELIEGDLEIERTSSDIRLSADQFGETDLILSTSLLEVGIDIPAIKIVSQYRAPWEMSQFVQRIGRASRKEGSDAHFLITLGEDATDRSLFQRAERFLEPEIDTPLDSDNEILQWTHNQIYRAFETAYRIRNTREYIEDRQQTFLERFLNDSEEAALNDFYEFADAPRKELQRYVQRQVDDPGSLWTTDGLRSAHKQLDSAMGDQVLTNIAKILGKPATRYTLQVSDIDTIEEDVQDEITTLTEEILEGLDTIETTTEAAETVLLEVREELESIPTTIQADTDRRTKFDDISETLSTVKHDLRDIADSLDGIPEEFPFNYGLSKYADAAREVRELRGQDDLVSKRKVWQRAYHLKRSIEELYCFVDQEFDGSVYGYMMVRAYKSLLRAVYFHNRAKILGQQRAQLEPPFYVATSYFGDAGETFSVISGDAEDDITQSDTVDALYQRRYNSQDDTTDQSEVSLTKLFYEYAPYMNKYLEDQSIQLFNPTVEETPGAAFDYHFNLESFQTEPGQNVITPITLPVKQVKDHSGNRAQSVVRYCTLCLDVKQGYEKNCDTNDCEGDIQYGRLRSNPQINTAFEPEVATDDDLDVSYLDADVRLESVELDIIPAEPSGDPTSGNSTPFSMEYDDTRTEQIGFDEPLGFSLKTRGVTWDVSELLATIRNDEALLRKFDRLNPDGDIEEVVHYTAAHYLLGLVSDVTGVNQSQLLYGVGTEDNEVAVFERAEGGQGVVDLFNRVRQQSEHDRLLEAINRVATNAQLLNGRLWANEEFVAAVRDGDWDEVTAIIETNVPVPTDTVVNNIREVTRSTADQLREFVKVTGIDTDRAYDLRQTAAELQFERGEEDVVEKLDSEHEDAVTETAIRNFLVEPDVDGCVENLQLKYSIVAGDQSNVLSYLILQRIQEEIIAHGEQDWGTDMLDNEAIPGANIDGTNIFHSL